MKSLALDRDTWDLVLDVNGNIAAVSEPYQLAQDAASACRTFLGECWYNGTLGVPYFQSFLGYPPNVPLIKQKMVGQARLVPGVVSAQVFLNTIVDRRATGQIQVTDENGDVTAAAF